jgi:hypothetical protein
MRGLSRLDSIDQRGACSAFQSLVWINRNACPIQTCSYEEGHMIVVGFPWKKRENMDGNVRITGGQVRVDAPVRIPEKGDHALGGGYGQRLRIGKRREQSMPSSSIQIRYAMNTGSDKRQPGLAGHK